jgi:hypothetical protein
MFISAVCPLMLLLGVSLGREYNLGKVMLTTSLSVFMFVKRRSQ